ncbi:hypothetical protein Ddc_15861 [Ditylenchus destructor]|nr:hypothetical protein Ddc_15861 [Ditylenchus destructor]
MFWFFFGDTVEAATEPKLWILAEALICPQLWPGGALFEGGGSQIHRDGPPYHRSVTLNRTLTGTLCLGSSRAKLYTIALPSDASRTRTDPFCLGRTRADLYTIAP